MFNCWDNKLTCYIKYSNISGFRSLIESWRLGNVAREAKKRRFSPPSSSVFSKKSLSLLYDYFPGALRELPRQVKKRQHLSFSERIAIPNPICMMSFDRCIIVKPIFSLFLKPDSTLRQTGLKIANPDRIF
jgi:hypothetical protein